MAGEEGTPPASNADQLVVEARTVYSEEGPRAALALFERALVAYQVAGDRLGEARVTGYLGNCRKHFGEYGEALELHARALAMKRELGDAIEEAKTLNHIGLVYWETARYDDAITRFTAALTIAREHDHDRIAAAVANNIGLVHDERGQHRAALARYAEVLEVHRRTGDRAGESATLGNVGGSHFALGNFRKAAEEHSRALALSRELGHKPSECQDLGNLALAEMWLDESAAALEHLEQALALARTAGLAKEEADWLRFRGSVQLRRGRHAEAIADYRAALAVYLKAEMRREQVEARLDLANAHLVLGDAASSRRELDVALALALEIGFERGRLQALELLGNLARRLRRPQKALERYREARERAGELGLEALEVALDLEIGAALMEVDDNAKLAKKHFDRALEAAERRGMRTDHALALHRLGELEAAAGRTEVALEHLNAGIAIADKIGNPEAAWRLHHGRGRALEQAGRNKKAVRAYRTAVERVEQIRGNLPNERLRAGYVDDKAALYRDLVALLLRLGRTGAAFEYVERSRARAYLDLLGSERPEAWATGSTPAHERERELRRKIEHLSSQIERADTAARSAGTTAAHSPELARELAESRRHYAAVLRDLRAADPAFASLLVVEPLVEADVQRLLSPGEALIEYYQTGDEIIAFVVTAERIAHVRRAVLKRDLQAKVELLRDRLRLGGSGDGWRGPAVSLHSLLLKPAETAHLLDDINSLYLVPHGVLHYLPFALLHDPESGFAVERYDLAYLPSASTLQFCRARAEAAGGDGLLALAPDAARLRHTADEAVAVSRLFADAGRAVVGATASESFCKAHCGEFGYLHFATHGKLDRINPLFSQITLEAGDGEDGRLEVHEIMGLDLNARLVTLSACETGLSGGYFNDIPPGEDWVGLTRAFLYAGTPSVIATLWSVDDRSTTELMRRFYGHLRHTGTSHALAQAQRDVLRAAAEDGETVDPFHWAAFVLVGDRR